MAENSGVERNGAFKINDRDCYDIAFYTAVFGYHFERVKVYRSEMAMFPASDEAGGITGALETVQSNENTLFYSYIGYGI